MKHVLFKADAEDMEQVQQDLAEIKQHLGIPPRDEATAVELQEVEGIRSSLRGHDALGGAALTVPNLWAATVAASLFGTGRPTRRQAPSARLSPLVEPQGGRCDDRADAQTDRSAMTDYLPPTYRRFSSPTIRTSLRRSTAWGQQRWSTPAPSTSVRSISCN